MAQLLAKMPKVEDAPASCSFVFLCSCPSSPLHTAVLSQPSQRHGELGDSSRDCTWLGRQHPICITPGEEARAVGFQSSGTHVTEQMSKASERK